MNLTKRTLRTLASALYLASAYEYSLADALYLASA